MNKMLFALLFASVSFCATQEASAGKKKLQEEDKIVGTSTRRMPKTKPLTLKSAQKYIEEVIREEVKKDATGDAIETAMLKAVIQHGREANPQLARRTLFGQRNKDERHVWVLPAPKNEEPFEEK